MVEGSNGGHDGLSFRGGFGGKQKSDAPFYGDCRHRARRLRPLFPRSRHYEKDYDGEEGAMLFHWSGIKWRNDYAGVAAVNSFLTKMCDLECEDYNEWAYEYRFVRMGEEMDDNEQLGAGFEDVCISREINF